MADSKMKISSRLKMFFGDRGRAEEVSARIGVPARTLHNYIKGTSEPKASTIAALAEEAGVCVKWLITGEGPMRPGEKETTTPPKKPIPGSEPRLNERHYRLIHQATRVTARILEAERRVASPNDLADLVVIAIKEYLAHPDTKQDEDDGGIAF